jgi:hypothetical protein
MSTITIGVDLAKSVFSACEMDGLGHVVRRKDLRRDAFGPWLAQQPAGTVVAMEACSGAHYWARCCAEYGLQPKIIAAQFVTPFRKGRRTKNDRADAEAIATAARQGNMRFVPVKSVDQQVRLSWHRVREGYKVESLAIGNRIRGLLAEFGVIVAQTDLALRRLLGDLEAQAGLPAELKELLRDLAEHWTALRTHLDACDARIEAHARPKHRRRRGRYDRQRLRVQTRSRDGSMARSGTHAVFQRWTYAAGWDQLPWRCLPAHTADPGCANESAEGEVSGDRKGYARTTLDTLSRRTHAFRQGDRGHRQQTRAADMGHAGARRRLRPKRLPESSDASANPRRPRGLKFNLSFHVSAIR